MKQQQPGGRKNLPLKSMSPVEIAAAAQEAVNSADIAGVTVLRLVKKGPGLQQCAFELTDGTNNKTVILSAFMKTPSFVRKNAKVIPTGGRKNLPLKSMSPVEIAAAAQEAINAAGITGVTVLRLVKKGAGIQQCSFEFTDGTHNKTVALSAFMKTSSFVRKNAKVIPTGDQATPLPYAKSNLVVATDPNSGRGLTYYEPKFYEVFSHDDVELLECSVQTGFLIRIKKDGGFLRRYKSFAQVLEYDPNFNRANNGPYYIGRSIIDAGYEVELEYTIPNTQYRFDMAIWTPDRKRLIGFIEHDGIQHTEKVGQFGDTDESLKKRKDSDREKENFAAAIAVPLYRVTDPGGQWTRDTRERAKKAGREIIDLIANS